MIMCEQYNNRNGAGSHKACAEYSDRQIISQFTISLLFQEKQSKFGKMADDE